ncbi:MAG: flagellar hook protein FlgE [Thiohalomonadales bacterium]
MPFRIGLSGLNAAATDLKVTGNNIANAGTTGYKQSRADFTDVFAVAFGGTSQSATGNGVRVSGIAQEFSQGSIEFSDKALDLAISGSGFFILDDSSGRTYSRNGSFNVNSSGDVVNSQNKLLQVFPVSSNANSTSSTTFNTGALTSLNLSTTDGPPSATSQITAGLNLDAAAKPPLTTPFSQTDSTSYTSTTSVIVYDSLGANHTASLYYTKTANPNEWETRMFVDNFEVDDTSNNSPSLITFGADGTLATPASGAIPYTPITSADLGLSTSIAPLDINMSYTSTTQFGNAFSVNQLAQDGFTSGRLSGIDIDKEGVVFARYTNGQSTVLGKVALATFPNPQGLRQLGDTSWAETFESGILPPGEAGTGSLGLFQSGALEASNVDVATQLVNLITAQRSFQANAQVISAADTVTQTIINI